MVQVGFGTTVTVKLHSLRLPHGSTATHVTVVVPTGNTLPDGGVQVTGTGPAQLSVALDWKTTWLLHSPTVVSRAQVTTGGVGATKLCGWPRVARWPPPSVAFQVRSIPGPPVQPAGVGESVEPIVTAAGQLSVAVAEPVWPGSVGSPHCRFLSGGQVIIGG